MAIKSSTVPLARPDLADPVTYGEDLAHNLKRTMAIAPKICAGCADYHIISVLKRLVGKTVWERGARTALLDTLGPLFAEFVERDRLDVVIAACADTAVLSTCAHAAMLAGDATLAKTRFTVVDRCPTPLALCQEYGDRHGLQVQTDIVELLETPKDFPADLIVLHNFLPFVPEDQQRPLLRAFGRWLKVGGRLVIWNPVLAPEDRGTNRSTERTRHADIRAMVEDGTIDIGEPRENLFARLERNVDDHRPGELSFTEVDSLPRLIASAGLETRSVVEMPQVRGWRSKLYVMVVAGPPDARS